MLTFMNLFINLHNDNRLIFIFVFTTMQGSLFLLSEALATVNTHSSMALFHMMTYPDKIKDSMLTMCVFPRSVPTYSHLLWKGRWQNVILDKQKHKKSKC